MIQRIQSLFLLGALILIATCFFLPIAEIYIPNSDIYSFNLVGFKLKNEIIRNTSLMISGILICSISMVTIFLYKKRILQMRLCVYNIVLLLGLNFIVFFLIMNVKKENSALVYYQITSIFPVIAAILTFLAFRSIRKDEKLVKSYDRIR